VDSLRDFPLRYVKKPDGLYIHSIYSAYLWKPPAAESGGHQPNLARHRAGFEDQTFGKQKKTRENKKNNIFPEVFAGWEGPAKSLQIFFCCFFPRENKKTHIFPEVFAGWEGPAKSLQILCVFFVFLLFLEKTKNKKNTMFQRFWGMGGSSQESPNIVLFFPMFFGFWYPRHCFSIFLGFW
jgi:hypothetical protein